MSPMLRKNTRRLPLGTLAAAMMVALAGCAVGPDFKAPTAPQATAYTPEPLPASTSASAVGGGGAQRFVTGMDIPGQWWTLFRSEALDKMIAAALLANPNLQAAQAALRVAQENVYARRGALFPTVGASFESNRAKVAGDVSSPLDSGQQLFTLHTAQLNVSYTPDVFGGTRRTVESAQAQRDMQRYQLEAAYLSLTSNLVAAAVQDAALRAQIANTETVIRIGSDVLDLLRKQYDLGAIGMSDVVVQEQSVAQAQATLPGLQKQLAQQRDLLAALTGRLPDDPMIEAFDLDSLTLPADLPVSLPSRMIEQRPDVAAATALLHAATADVGVATANMLPQFTLVASLGSASSQFGNLFGPGTALWSLLGGITQPLFAGGTLLHQKRGAEAALDQAGAEYRATVLNAFQNVADSLNALKYDADTVRLQLVSERAAARSLDIAQKSLKLGATSYFSVLTAQQAYQEAASALTQARVDRYTDTVALFQALGGGWWNRQDVVATNPSTGSVASNGVSAGGAP